MFARWRYEFRAVGWGNLSMPCIVAAIFLSVALLAALETKGATWTSQSTHGYVALGLLYVLEFGVPPVAGLCAAYLIASDPAKELHLALSSSYSATMLRRLGILLVWTALLCGVGVVLIERQGYWIAPQRDPVNQLTWLAPLVWFVFGGAMLSLLVGSRIASSAVLGMLWIAELLFRWYFLRQPLLRKVYAFLTLATVQNGPAPGATDWMSNRVTLMLLAGGFFIGLLVLLRNNEALLGHEP